MNIGNSFNYRFNPSFSYPLMNNSKQSSFEISDLGFSSKAYTFQNILEKQNTAKASQGTVKNTDNIQLRTLHTQTEEDEEKCVGSLVDLVNNTSTSVFKPKDFDPDNPVYKVKIYDSNGNYEEKTVNVLEVNPNNCDSYEMYAYSSYLSESGKFPEAQKRFIMAKAIAQSSHKFSTTAENFVETKQNWVEAVRQAMEMQLDGGNRQGFLKYKKFYNFLEKSV